MDRGNPWEHVQLSTLTTPSSKKNYSFSLCSCQLFPNKGGSLWALPLSKLEFWLAWSSTDLGLITAVQAHECNGWAWDSNSFRPLVLTSLLPPLFALLNKDKCNDWKHQRRDTRSTSPSHTHLGGAENWTPDLEYVRQVFCHFAVPLARWSMIWVSGQL